MSVIKNVPVRWASVIKPETTFDPVWTIEVILTEEQADRLKKEAKAVNPKGIKIKKDDEGNLVFRFKRKVMKANGEENNPPVCKGTKRDLLTGKLEDFTQLIGNGSICNVQYLFYEWENKFGSGVGADLKGVQVVEHVPYGVADGDEFDELGSEETSEDSEGFDDEDFE
jgi:hypothetical protein